jgi:hypothetical protein
MRFAASFYIGALLVAQGSPVDGGPMLCPCCGKDTITFWRKLQFKVYHIYKCPSCNCRLRSNTSWKYVELFATLSGLFLGLMVHARNVDLVIFCFAGIALGIAIDYWLVALERVDGAAVDPPAPVP